MDCTYRFILDYGERTKFLDNEMIFNHVTYKHLLNSTNASTLKQVSKFIGTIFSEFVYNGKY